MVDQKYPKKLEDDTSDETGSGGKSGHIEFREFIASTESLRDDLLPVDEKKRLLIVHKDTQLDKVKKQKELRDVRQAIKDGKIPLQSYRHGIMEAAANAGFKAHPLSNSAQWSGRDRQITELPSEHLAETNPKDRDELQLQFSLRHQPEFVNAPKNTPKLTRT